LQKGENGKIKIEYDDLLYALAKATWEQNTITRECLIANKY